LYLHLCLHQSSSFLLFSALPDLSTAMKGQEGCQKPAYRKLMNVQDKDARSINVDMEEVERVESVKASFDYQRVRQSAMPLSTVLGSA